MDYLKLTMNANHFEHLLHLAERVISQTTTWGEGLGARVMTEDTVPHQLIPLTCVAALFPPWSPPGGTEQ